MKSKMRAVLVSGLIAGTLDILAAIVVYDLILQKTTATKILQSIASAIFKREAYTGGLSMAFCGLLFHFLIAFAFALFYFLIYPHFSLLKKNVWLSGILYGILVWIVMNLIVLPIAFPILPEKHLDFPLLLSIIILIFCVGIPIAIRAKKYYTVKQ